MNAREQVIERVHPHGQKTCANTNRSCPGFGWEATSNVCRACGGPFPDEQQIRRILARQLLHCYGEIVYLAPEVDKYKFLRGAAYAIGGIMSQLGFHEDAKPIMDELFEKTGWTP